MFPTLVKPLQSNGAFARSPRHRHLYTRAITTRLNCQIWHERSHHTTQQAGYEKIVGAQGRRYASSSAAPAKRTGHNITAAPPPLSKTNSTRVPAKTTPSRPLQAARNSPSSALPPAPVQQSKSATTPTLRALEKLNPPPFAYAPEISVPARKADQNLIKWLWTAGRAYLAFYKKGISHVRQTAKLAKSLRKKAAAHTPKKPMTEVLTRAEWQVVRRSRRDVLRLPVFGVLVLVLGEWLPVVVLYLTPVIPEVCRIPRQVERTLRKKEDKRQDRLRKIGLEAMRLVGRDRPATTVSADAASSAVAGTKGKSWKDMSLYELCVSAAKLDVYPAVFDWVPLAPPKFWMQRNVRRKLEYLETDYKLIERDGGIGGLNAEEVKRACVERGVKVLGRKEEELRRALAGVWAEMKR
ncbi:hypothetical protein COCMIDRAFT_25574 [Bipolaris oryzae ATCC 44560]|uniref:Letm1 RBD domain-containing protein n=1 Tax=Bipolaris oryzae ATCC 44560 TaxID=930090 RepID=W6Z8N7_COCMI|nr:uncharacterized protein COCMIDRAFT_25574 [Bipolaris oryzae ATCC 44560]EUC46360.1 hypothetical protein COCMIDRAFT_25574 [Bipolaris oryzae ATCC 44560]